jgi:L-ascorbate metabolism protein UlaG (beta-lactamase superfamily)
MHFSWYGQSCFKIVSKEATIIMDPFDRTMTGLEPPRSKADVVVFSNVSSDRAAEYKQADFSIVGPGEYEVKNIYFYGFPVPRDNKGDKTKGYSTAFLIEGDDLKILYVGDAGVKNISNEQLEEIGDIDIMLVPVGGTDTLDAEDAEKLVRQIDPRIVIPMHYSVPKLKIKLDGVEKFLKEIGSGKKEVLPKYVVKKKDIPEEGTEVVVLDLATGE